AASPFLAVAHGLNNLFAKNILVTNIRCNDLIFVDEQALALSPAIEVAERDPHLIDKPSEPIWYEFTERDQVLLVVTLLKASGQQCVERGGRGEANGAIGVAVRPFAAIMQRDAHNDAGIALFGDVQPLAPDLRRDLVLEQGHDG